MAPIRQAPAQPVARTSQPAPAEPTAAAAAGDPAVVRPQEHLRARRTVALSEPSRKLQPGDLVCGDCGEANLPTRKFCSRCGSSLADAQAVQAPWWRRILPRRKPRRADEPKPGVLAAADRPQRRQHRRRIFPIVRRTVAVLLLLGGILYATVPAVRDWVNPRVHAGRTWVEQTLLTQYAPVRAVKVTSPAPEEKQHPPAAAADTFKNTHWLTPVDGPKALKLEFQDPAEPRRAIIRGGIKDNLRGSQRPRTLHVVWPTGRTQDLVMADHVDEQRFELDSGGPVTSVEIFVQDTYQSVESKHVAISEIELFVEKK